ncbi:MAG: AgrD family cyclic lactone autoinducer peptide [Clostridia bacterium]|jgi:cyclic lactone autoinducer peptide|nr:cyclic lactone autoinducer peptide [Clostridiales bacterium]
MKKVNVFALLTTLLTVVAAAFAGSASFSYFHQPETPKALRK